MSTKASSSQGRRTAPQPQTIGKLMEHLPSVRETIAAVLTTGSARLTKGSRPVITEGNRSKHTEGNRSKQGGQRRKAPTAGMPKGGQPRNQSGKGRGPIKGNTAAARTQRGRNERGNDSRTGQSGTSQQSQRRDAPRVYWTLAKSKRPVFAFDEAETGKVLKSLQTTLFVDSQGAAVAFAHYVAMHRDHRYQGEAFSTLGGFLTQLRPTAASFALAEQATREMSQTSEPRDGLSANLFLDGQRYLRLYTQPSGRGVALGIADKLLKNADAFERLDSNRRQACGLIMAADILHTLGDFDRAKKLWVRALTLISVAYQAQKVIDLSEAMIFSEALLNLAKSADPQIVEETISHRETSHNGGHHIEQAPAGTFAG